MTEEFHACALKNVKEDREVWFNTLMDMQFRLAAMGYVVSEEMMMSHILAKMPKDYNGIIMTTYQLMAVTPTLVTLKMVQDSIRQFWKTEKPKGEGGEEAFAFAKKFKGTCYNCGKQGHKGSECRSKESGE